MANKFHLLLHRIALGLLLAATLLYTLLLQKQAVLAQADADGQPPLQSPFYSSLLLGPGAEPAIMQYAELMGISYAEGDRRLFLQGEMTGLREQVSQNEPTYAGSWMQHTPTFGLVFAFASPDPQAILAPYLIGIPWADLVSARQARYTMPELEANAEKVSQITYTSDIVGQHVVASGINIQEGKVRLYTPNPDVLRAIFEREHFLEQVGLTLDDIEFPYQAAPMVPLAEVPAANAAPAAPISPLPWPPSANVCHPQRV